MVLRIKGYHYSELISTPTTNHGTEKIKGRHKKDIGEATTGLQGVLQKIQLRARG